MIRIIRILFMFFILIIKPYLVNPVIPSKFFKFFSRKYKNFIDNVLIMMGLE
jgi:hypothetical protein